MQLCIDMRRRTRTVSMAARLVQEMLREIPNIIMRYLNLDRYITYVDPPAYVPASRCLPCGEPPGMVCEWNVLEEVEVPRGRPAAARVLSSTRGKAKAAAMPAA